MFQFLATLSVSESILPAGNGNCGPDCSYEVYFEQDQLVLHLSGSGYITNNDTEKCNFENIMNYTTDPFMGYPRISKIVIEEGLEGIDSNVMSLSNDDPTSLYIREIHIPKSLRHIGPDSLCGFNVEKIYYDPGETNIDIDETAFMELHTSPPRIYVYAPFYNLTMGKYFTITDDIIDSSKYRREPFVDKDGGKFWFHPEVFGTDATYIRIELVGPTRRIADYPRPILASNFPNLQLVTIEYPNDATNHRITHIGSGWFQKLTHLKTITGLTKVHEEAPESERKALLTNDDMQSLEYIASYAFTDSAITSIAIPKSVTFLGEGVFCNCKSLQEVEFPEDTQLTKIAMKLFYNCDLQIINLPEKITEIGIESFARNGNIQTVKIPGVTKIQKGAFNASVVMAFEFPINLTNSESAFEGASVYSISVNPTVKVITSRLFMGSSMTSFTIPESIEEIQAEAFKNSKDLASIKFSKNLKKIDESAFENTALKKLDIPQSVESIGINAFKKCDIEEIKYSGLTDPGKEQNYTVNAFGGGRPEKLGDIEVPSDYESEGDLFCGVSLKKEAKDGKTDDGSSLTTGAVVGIICAVVVVVAIVVSLIIILVFRKDKNEENIDLEDVQEAWVSKFFLFILFYILV